MITATGGTVLKGLSFQKVENHGPRPYMKCDAHTQTQTSALQTHERVQFLYRATLFGAPGLNGLQKLTSYTQSYEMPSRSLF